MATHGHAGAHGTVYRHCHVELIGAVRILHHVGHLRERERALQRWRWRIGAVRNHVHEDRVVIQETGVFLLHRDAKVLKLDQFWSRPEVGQFWVVVGEGQPVIPRVLKRVVADQVMHDVVPLDTDCLLD